jgi:hypothetical protein
MTLANIKPIKVQVKTEYSTIGKPPPGLMDFNFAMPTASVSGGFTGGGGGGGGMSRAQKAAEAARKAEEEILNKRKQALESFNQSVESLFGQMKNSMLSAFTLPNLGNSLSSITRNMNKLLESTKKFSANITKLSDLKLNSTLLQQVISAGPIAGAQLAQAIANGGQGFIDQLNAGYSEFDTLVGGIANVGTTSAFADKQTVNNYSVQVTGGLATGADVGRAVVNAIKDFERQSGTAWRG